MNDFDGFTKKWWDRKCGISGICVSLIMLALEIKSSSNARLRSHIIQSTESESITVPRCTHIEPVLVGPRLSPYESACMDAFVHISAVP